MTGKNFFKDNFVLLVGLALPVVVMVGFMIMAAVPQTLADPPKHDLVFWTVEYDYNKQIPVNVNLVVKDGVLHAQYTKVKERSYNNQWPKLYQFEAATQKVRELSLPYPEDMDQITTMRDDVVDATKNLKLSTVTTSPDGYELAYKGYGRRGLVNEIFFDFDRGSGDACLKKGGACVRLVTGSTNASFYHTNAHFLGWVTP